MIKEDQFHFKVDPTLGIVFKNLRKAKGFSQKDAVGNILSLAQLSKFENGKVNISAIHFFHILENICTNMYEFQYSYEEYLMAKDILLFNTELSRAYLEGNIVKLKILLEKISLDQKKYSDYSSIPKKKILDEIRVKILISVLEPSFFIPKNEIDYIKDYFKTLKQWGQYDILLLGHCANVLDSLDLYLVGRELIRPDQLLIKLHYVKHSMIQTLLNIIAVLTEKKAYQFANTFISYFDKNDIHEYYMYEKLMLIHNKAILDYKSGDISALKTLDKCKEIMIFCKCMNTANLMDREMTDLTNE
jgi:HTH-type transcriptional regulator, SHP2-responsive activator